MNEWILALAIAVQTADAANTCRGLASGAREANPLLGQSCASVVAVKAAFFSPLVVPIGRRAKNVIGVGLIAGGGVGVTLSLRLGPK